MAFIKESFLKEKAEDYRLKTFAESYEADSDWSKGPYKDMVKAKHDCS